MYNVHVVAQQRISPTASDDGQQAAQFSGNYLVAMID